MSHELPAWYPWPETETKPAPMPLLLVQAFANTLDVTQGEDLLADAGWFVRAGLLAPGVSLDADELALARSVRAALRELLSGGDADLAPLRTAAARRDPRIAIADGGQIALEARVPGDLDDALLALLLVVRAAQVDGTWKRLRICANDECRWAFYDRSRNQQGHWCDMAVCGNRIKNREFRARRRA
jgi:predicted RNA-binding Zn ribbon-like protein